MLKAEGRLTVAAMAALAVAACAADGADPEAHLMSPAAPAVSAAPAGMAPAEIVRARQAAYHLSGATMGAIHATVVEGPADPDTQVYATRGLARWARALPTMFPESTRGVGPTRAKPEIWDNKADFDAKAGAYAAAAEKMAEVAATGDKPAFIAAWQATRATCGACHSLYQAPAQPRP